MFASPPQPSLRRAVPRRRTWVTVGAVAVLAGALCGCGRSDADSSERVFEQPPSGVTSAALIVDTAADAVTVVSEPIAPLYHVDIAHGSGTSPDVRLDRSAQTVTISTAPSGAAGSAEVASIEVVVNESVPWRVQINRRVRNLDLEMERVTLLGLDVRGDGDVLAGRLPVPQGTLPVAVSGTLSTVDLNVQFAPVQLRLDGGAAELSFLRTDERSVGPGDTRTGNGDFTTALSRYDVRVGHTAETVILGQD